MSNRYNEHDDSIRKLSKDDECALMWRWQEDRSLQLVYKTFDNFIRVYTNTGN